MTPNQADSLLADALWWFKGFRAAQPVDSVDPTDALSDSLRNVRQWLIGLSQGHRRLLGTNERQYAVVLTEAEFERIYDGLKHRTVEDLDLGLTTAKAILEQFTAERREAALPDGAPF